MVFDNRIGNRMFAEDVALQRALYRAQGQRLPPHLRLDSRDYANILRGVGTGRVDDWQRNDAREIIAAMRASPRTFSQDRCQRSLHRLCMGVENRYCRPDHGWQAHHRGRPFIGAARREAEYREMVNWARDNERSQRRALNTSMGIMAIGGLIKAMSDLA